MPKMAVDRDHTPFIIDQGRGIQLCRELERAGIEPRLTANRDAVLSSGVALSVDATAAQRSTGAATQFREQAFDVLVNGLPLSVSVLHLDAAASEALSGVCELLRLAAQDAGAVTDDISIAVSAEAISPQAACMTRCEVLGDGPVFVLPGCTMMRPGESALERSRHDRLWLQLWHLRLTRILRPAYAPYVSSACPLLSGEIAQGVMPVTDIQAPTGSAWVSMNLDITKFADRNGTIHDSELEATLCRAVEIGDELQGNLAWPTAQMRHDAWLNRRLAINLTGLGDLLQMRQTDPSRFAALEGLCDVMSCVREILLRQSRRIATLTEIVPAIEQADPSRLLPGGQARTGWRKRWRSAVAQVATRHRNLLVLSPWSVFPADEVADYRYANLLPLLGFADACAFPRPPDLAHWNVNQFKSFHQRAWAVLQQRDMSHQIAEGI